jgi:hypothetical protein
LASAAPFLRRMVAQCECPDIVLSPINSGGMGKLV